MKAKIHLYSFLTELKTKRFQWTAKTKPPGLAVPAYNSTTICNATCLDRSLFVNTLHSKVQDTVFVLAFLYTSVSNVFGQHFGKNAFFYYIAAIMDQILN